MNDTGSRHPGRPDLLPRSRTATVLLTQQPSAGPQGLPSVWGVGRLCHVEEEPGAEGPVRVLGGGVAVLAPSGGQARAGLVGGGDWVGSEEPLPRTQPRGQAWRGRGVGNASELRRRTGGQCRWWTGGCLQARPEPLRRMGGPEILDQGKRVWSHTLWGKSSGEPSGP